MITRDVLDYQGSVIGSMNFPDDATEDEIAAALAPYAAPPPSPTEQLNQTIERTVQESREAAERIMQAFKKSNLVAFLTDGISNDLAIMKSMWIHHRLRALDVTIGGVPMTIDLLNLCISGDLETAAVCVDLATPDDMSEPYHFLSAEVLALLRQLIRDEIGF